MWVFGLLPCRLEVDWWAKFVDWVWRRILVVAAQSIICSYLSGSYYFCSLYNIINVNSNEIWHLRLRQIWAAGDRQSTESSRFRQVSTDSDRFPSVPVSLWCRELPLASLPDINCFEQLWTVRLSTGTEAESAPLRGFINTRCTIGKAYQAITWLFTSYMPFSGFTVICPENAETFFFSPLSSHIVTRTLCNVAYS